MRRLLAAITLSLISSSAIATGGTSPAHDQSLIAGQAGDRAKQPDTSPQQLALVIGNSGYRHSPLATPGNDARTMAKLLHERLGFNPGEVKDLFDQRATKENFFRSVDWLVQSSSPGDQVVLYMACYGSHCPDASGDETLGPALAALREMAGRRRLLVVERIDGVPARQSPLREALLAHGFVDDYRGLMLD